MLIVAIVFLLLFFISARYGGYTITSWGFLVKDWFETGRKFCLTCFWRFLWCSVTFSPIALFKVS
jgi:hypothetical protein